MPGASGGHERCDAKVNVRRVHYQLALRAQRLQQHPHHRQVARLRRQRQRGHGAPVKVFPCVGAGAVFQCLPHLFRRALFAQPGELLLVHRRLRAKRQQERRAERGGQQKTCEPHACFSFVLWV